MWRQGQRLEWYTYKLGNHQKLEKGMEQISPQEPSGRTWVCGHLDFRRLPPELWENKFCCLSPPGGGTLLQQLQETHTPLWYELGYKPMASSLTNTKSHESNKNYVHVKGLDGQEKLLLPSSHHFLSPLPADEKATHELQWTALEERNSGSDNSELKYPVSTKIKSHMPSLEPKSANLLTS